MILHSSTVTVRTGTIEEIIELDQAIPEFERKTSKEKLLSRLQGVTSLILVSCCDGKPVAYKAGYHIDDREFYSWLGGVVPAFRKRGIATILRERQEAWALEQGYQWVSVKSMNKYPPMLQLLLASGYQICGYEDNGSTDNSKIRFIKQLRR
ncbi:MULTISPECIES: GNAT family N-acetyltransferase [Aliagarivorans]|uniref:GNAT family N-acetyltransferase n=1 Tax=Aliagarivorans TaxID=882379 RepID=UPI000557768A|nr:MULTISPECIES: GNAT family N-acetyltransferase [Aliagarivorans]